MSKSPKDRAENREKALRTMASIIGEGRFDFTLFERDDPSFKDILVTTWEAMENGGQLRRTSNWDCRLTANGWVSALQAAGILGDPTFKENLGKLCAVIKRRCEEGGRHRAGTTIQELAEETGFSEGWLYNAIECHLIQVCLHRVDCDWEPGDEEGKNYVMIPARFGEPL